MRSLMFVVFLLASQRSIAADTVSAAPTLRPTIIVDLPFVDRAIVGYWWRSDRPMEVRWSTSDTDTMPAGTVLRTRLLSESVDVGGGWRQLGATAHELDGTRVAGWGWAWMGNFWMGR